MCLNAGNEHFWALTSHYQGRNRIEIPTFPAPSQAATSVLHVGFTVNREVTQERSSFGAGASMLPPRSRGLAGSMQAAAAVAGILNPGSRHGLGGTAGRAPRALGLTPFSQRLDKNNKSTQNTTHNNTPPHTTHNPNKINTIPKWCVGVFFFFCVFVWCVGVFLLVFVW